MKVKPTVILYEDDYKKQKKGLLALENVLVNEYGFDH